MSNVHPTPASPPVEADPLFTHDHASAKAQATRSPGILRRLAGRFWQILLVWVMLAAAVTFLIYLSFQPTYEAVSLLRIEPATPNLFEPVNRESPSARSQNLIYLKTQVGLITSDKVLNPAIAGPLVVNLPTIQKAVDPKSDLLEKLRVAIVEDTNLIRIALELPDPEQAVIIVQAVVQSYLTQNTDYSRSANRDLTESLKQQLLKIANQVDDKRMQLRELSQHAQLDSIKPRELSNPKTETDPTQPTLNKVTAEQFAKLIERQVECDLEYLDALAQLEAVRSVRERNLDRLGQELESRVLDEFKNDSRVGALIDQIDESKKMGESKDKDSPSPAVLAARLKHETLMKEYDALRARRTREIRRRLVETDRGPFSEARTRELEVAVEKARRKKEAFAQQFEKVEVIRERAGDAAFEASYLNRQISTLANSEELVKKNLEQLRFEASQDKYRVVLIDPGAASHTPSNNKRLRYMAAAPAVILFALLCLFLTQEIVAGRRKAAGG